MSDPGDTFQHATDAITAVLTRLTTELQSEEGARALLERLGWSDLPAVPSELLAVGQALDDLASARGDLTDALMDLEDGTDDSDNVVEKLAAVVGQLALVILHSSKLNESASNELPGLANTGIGQDLERRFFDSLVYQAISREFSLAARVLTFLGILERTRVKADPDPTKHVPNFTLLRVNWGRLSTVLNGPAAIMGDVYGWGTPNINTARLFDALLGLSVEFLEAGDIVAPSPAFLAAIAPGVTISDDGPEPMLVLPIAARNGAVLAVGVVPIPKAAPDEVQGLGFHLIGEGAFDQELPLAPGVTLEIEAKADLVVGVGAILRPGSFSVFTNPEGTPAAFAGGSIMGTVARKMQEGEEPIRLLTFPGGPFVDAEELFFSAGVNATGTSADVFAKAGIAHGRFVVPKGDQDSFTSSLMPENGVQAKFDFALGWSRLRGVFVEGSGKLEITLPINQSIGPFEIQAIRVGLSPSAGGLELTAGIVGSAALGPVTVSVDALSVTGNLRFQSGNLGVLDLGIGLKAPRGYGIFIDAGSVAGGGFLNIEPDAGRYSGALELRIYEINVKAFGLIETKVPGVPFSFIIVISAEFEPIQLGYGFMLLGIGGLIGINRSIKHDAIADAVANGRIDHVLFPDDLIGNASSIISDLGALFPATAGSYAFGPMAKLTWLFLVNGTIGLLLEWPSKKVVVIGTVRAALPRADNAIVKLKMDVAGELDFPGKHFELRASIDPEGSSAGGYKLSGDMAMLLDWGERPDFALSVGGFNPAYAPPPKFPHLRRMAIELGIEGNPRMTVQGYMALTSNTAQVGAKLDAEWHKYGADVRGYLGFDALIVFSPFHFTATLAGGVHVDFVGVGFDLSITATLSGPAPWRLDGEICVGVWPFEACPDFHIQLTGEEAKTTLTPLDPWFGAPTNVPAKDQDAPGLYPAILDLRNWRGVVEAGDFTGVTYLETGAADQKVDPVGTATFMQKAVPLNYDITRFADTTPSRKGELKIQFVAVGGQLAEIQPKGDWFAPGRYHEMNDTQKLESPAFEFLNAGVTITSASVRIGTVAAKTISYQSFLMAEDGKTTDLGTGATPTPTQLTGMATATFAARPAVRTLGGARFTDFTLQPKLQHDLVTYRVVTKSTLTNAPGGLSTTLTRTQAAWALAGLVGPALSTKQVYQIISNPQLSAA